MKYRLKSHRYLIGCAVVSYFFYSIMQLSLFNNLTPYLLTHLSISHLKFGVLSSTYFYALAVTLIPAGYLLDHYGTRKTTLITLCFSVISTFILFISQSVTSIAIYRIITGIANGIAFLASLRVANYWFQEKRSLASGIMISIGMSGGFFAAIFFTSLATRFSWHIALAYNFSIGLILIFFALIFLKNHMKEKGNARDELSKINLLKSSVSNWQNWRCGIYTGLLNLSVNVLAAVWGNFYLINRYHLPATSAALITSMIFIGVIIGSPFWGWFADKVNQRNIPMVLGSILSIMVMIGIMTDRTASIQPLLALFLLLGVTTSAQVISYSIIAESNPLKLLSTAMSFSALIINLIGAIAQPAYGFLLSEKSYFFVRDHIDKNLTNHFNWTLIFFIIAFLISALVALFKSNQSSAW